MNLIPNLIGYRLSMTSHSNFAVSQSLKVYQGFVAKIMVLLKLAFDQQFLVNGRQITLAIRHTSLAHFSWRHHLCRDAGQNYARDMKNLYRISHQIGNREHKIHRFCTNEMGNFLKQRDLFKVPMTFEYFLEIVKKQSPLKAFFYKIKKDEKTVGYLLGTVHVGNKLIENLNPKINQAIRKSKIFAWERAPNAPACPIRIRPELKDKYKRFVYVLNRSLAISGMSIHYGLEECLHRKIQTLGEPKEFISLESPEEQERDCNLFLKDFDIKEKPSGKKVIKMFRHTLAGDTESAEKFIHCFSPSYKKSLDKRNGDMVTSMVPILERQPLGITRAFFAVGDLHLHGENGIITKLKQRGYELDRIPK